MKPETELKILEEMAQPRPFSTPRIILARGAVGWFMNLVVAIIVMLLLTLSLSSLSRISRPSGGAFFFITGSLILVLVLLVKRIAEPFRITALLRTGTAGVFPIVKRENTYSVLSRIGSKHRSAYTIRFGSKPEDPGLVTKLEGTDLYRGDTTVLLYRTPEGGAPGEGNRLQADAFFALDCFLHHRLLTLPDLLEGEAQKRGAELQNQEDQAEWKNILGNTWPSLFGRFAMAVGIILAIGTALFMVFRMQ